MIPAGLCPSRQVARSDGSEGNTVDERAFAALVTRLTTVTVTRPSRRGVLRTLGALSLGTIVPTPSPINAKPKRCKPGKRRCQGRCIPRASCCFAADCAAPQPCVDGACVRAGCTSDAQCSAGQHCLSGICRDRVPCGTNAGCASDEVCWAFVCTPAGGPCPGDGDCPYNQVCRDGQCLGGGLCFLDDNCRAFQVCTGGVCQGGQGD